MALRLATEYNQSRLVLSEPEIRQLCDLLKSHELHVEITYLSTGSCVVRAEKDQERIDLPFDRVNDRYVFEGDIRMHQSALVHAMRGVVSAFRGHAIVNRIYQQFTISYYYEHGTVTRIVEHHGGQEQKIFERRHQHGETIPQLTATATQERLQQLFGCLAVEQRIASLRAEVDQWLDIRNRIHRSTLLVPDQLLAVDRQLARLQQCLLACEAI
jgi:hypothetical protein